MTPQVPERFRQKRKKEKKDEEGRRIQIEEPREARTATKRAGDLHMGPQSHLLRGYDADS